MNELNMDVINKALKLIEESRPSHPLEMILLTDIIDKEEAYLLETEEKRYLCIPHKTWALILRETEPKSFCNHVNMFSLCISYDGIPIYENDELVMEILAYIFKKLNKDKNMNKYEKNKDEDKSWILNNGNLWVNKKH